MRNCDSYIRQINCLFIFIKTLTLVNKDTNNYMLRLKINVSKKLYTRFILIWYTTLPCWKPFWNVLEFVARSSHYRLQQVLAGLFETRLWLRSSLVCLINNCFENVLYLQQANTTSLKACAQTTLFEEALCWSVVSQGRHLKQATFKSNQPQHAK